MSAGTKQRVVGYLNENWGALFVLIALVLLLYTTNDVVNDNLSYGNEVAIYAYFSLLAGIVLQFFSAWTRRGSKAVSSK